MAETYAGMLARTLVELGSRELSALACENQWHEDPALWQEQQRRSAVTAIAYRAEDAQWAAEDKRHAMAIGPCQLCMYLLHGGVVSQFPACRDNAACADRPNGAQCPCQKVCR